MDAFHLRDMLSRGMGNAARALGDEYDLFRPAGFREPLASGNLLMRLPVLFHERSRSERLSGSGEGLLEATFDGIAAAVGDYLRGPGGVLFICGLPPLRRTQCMLTNRTVDVLRANRAAAGGLGRYGGVTEDFLDMVLGGWPVNFRFGSGAGTGGLPADGGRSAATVWFPQGVPAICASDLVQDDLGRRFVVRMAEETEAGWRLSVAGTEV